MSLLCLYSTFEDLFWLHFQQLESEQKFVIILIQVFFLNNIMIILKLDIPLFYGRMYFSLWQCTIQDHLVQQGLDCAVEKEKLSEMKELYWNSLHKEVVSNSVWHLLQGLK